MKIALIFIIFFGHEMLMAKVKSFDEIKKEYKNSEQILLDKNGKFLEKREGPLLSSQFKWVSLEKISHSVKKALFLKEEKNFYLKSLRESILMKKVASLLNEKDVEGMSKIWTKEQVIEAYLNLSYFHQGVRGIQNSSEKFFNKSAMDLRDDEASILMASIGETRGLSSLKRMSCKFTEKEVCQKISALKSLGNHEIKKHVTNQYFVKKQGQENKEMLTTLDKELQTFVKDLLSKNNANHSAIVILENKTKKVLAYTHQGSDDLLLAHREVKGLLDPFVKGFFLEKKQQKISLNELSSLTRKLKLRNVKNLSVEHLEKSLIRPWDILFSYYYLFNTQLFSEKTKGHLFSTLKKDNGHVYIQSDDVAIGISRNYTVLTLSGQVDSKFLVSQVMKKAEVDVAVDDLVKYRQEKLTEKLTKRLIEKSHLR